MMDFMAFSHRYLKILGVVKLLFHSALKKHSKVQVTDTQTDYEPHTTGHLTNISHYFSSLQAAS